MRLAVVVPVKSHARAKHRLEAVLNDDERARLASAMAHDVLRAVGRLHEYGRFAVSEDPAILELARQCGVEGLRDGLMQGQSAAVRQGFAAVWERGYSAALTIPGDVPAVTAEELRAVCEFRPELEVLIVPDRDRRGTNGLRLTPPHAIPLRFGEDSMSLHRSEAQRAGRSVAVLEVPGLACDLDRPEDLSAFLGLAPASATHHLLQELRIPDRVASRPGA